MKEGKLVLVTHDGLSKKSFARASVWCEYYIPSEIDELVLRGESRGFLIKELVEYGENNDSEDSYYSLPEKLDLSLPEFSFIGADFNLGAMAIEGYICVVDREIRTAVLFINSTLKDLYLNEMFCDENRVVLNELEIAYGNEDHFIAVNYKLNTSDFGMSECGTVNVPLIDSSEGENDTNTNQ